MAHLSGQRAVHLDYARLQDSPLSEWAKFYQAGPDRLVFSSPDLLWAAIDKFFNGEFAVEYQQQLIDQYDEVLPENPPWSQ